MDITHDRAAWWLIVGGALVALAVFAPLTAVAETTEPIRIGVIGEESSVAGASLTKAAALAADEIKPMAASTAARSRSSPMTIIPPPPTRCAPSSAP